jgi:nitrate/nitrite transporter NarK
VIFSFATQPLIDRFSLAWSLRAIAVVSGSMLLVAALLLRTRNAAIQPRQHGFAVRLLVRYEVVLLLGWSFASLVGYIVLLFSLSDYAQAIGMSARRAADITGLVNVGTALGRPFVGALSDRWGRIEVAGIVTAVCGISVFAVWVPAEEGGEAVVMLFAVLAGATLGTFWVAIGPLCVEVVGLVELPALLSLAWVVIVGPCTGEFVLIVLVLCVVCLVLRCVLFCLLSCGR